MADIKRDLLGDLAATSSDSWRTLRIMAETVSAMDILNSVNVNCISIFGSARSPKDSAEYQAAEKMASLLVNAGFGIITGGGPGVMEAANKGAADAGGISIGLHIKLPQEQGCNPYVNVRCSFRYFFIRKFMFVKYASAYVVMPGGMGTVDELSEAFVLAQTGRSRPFPIILYNSGFWNGFLDWVTKSMIGNGFIRSEEVARHIAVCDTPEDVVAHLCKIVIL